MYATVIGPMCTPMYPTLTPTPVKHFWMLINELCLSHGNLRLGMRDQSCLKSSQTGILDAMILNSYGSCKENRRRPYSALHQDWETLPHTVYVLWIVWYRQVIATWVCMDKQRLGKSPSSLCVILNGWWAISFHLKDMNSDIIMTHIYCVNGVSTRCSNR